MCVDPLLTEDGACRHWLGGGRGGVRGRRGCEGGGRAVTTLGEGRAGWGGAAGFSTRVSRYCARFTPGHPVHVVIPPGCEITQHTTVLRVGSKVITFSRVTVEVEEEGWVMGGQWMTTRAHWVIIISIRHV